MGRDIPMGQCSRANAHLGEAHLGLNREDKWDACGWEGTFGERRLTGHRHGGRRAQNTSVCSHLLLLEHRMRLSTSAGGMTHACGSTSLLGEAGRGGTLMMTCV